MQNGWERKEEETRGGKKRRSLYRRPVLDCMQKHEIKDTAAFRITYVARLAKPQTGKNRCERKELDCT